MEKLLSYSELNQEAKQKARHAFIDNSCEVWIEEQMLASGYTFTKDGSKFNVREVQ